MPTYVYRRLDGTTFEKFQKMSDAPLTEDPETGEPVQRMISGGAGLQFKGDGFYLTDYVHKNRKGDGEKAESTSKKTGSSSSTKTESSTKAASSSDD